MQLAALHLQLAPILAAEKSKVPFYILGGVLVVWALVLSLGIGMRNPNFPGSLRAQRIVIAISVVLVLATVTSAVLTSSLPSTRARVTKEQKVTLAGAPIPSQPAVTETTATSTTSTSTTSTSSAENEKEPAPTVGEEGHMLTVAANAGGLLAYNAKTLKASAGKVTIKFANFSPVEHNITIAQGTKVLGATPTFIGGSRSVTVTLKPGKYVFYCSVPGHRQAGMEGTLTVSSAPVPNTSSTGASSASSTSASSSSSSSSTGSSSAASEKEPPASSGEGGHTLTVAANPTGLLAYTAKTLTASAGKVTIKFTNESPVEHNITIAQGTKVLGATPTFKGGSRTLTVTLKAGKYVFYCSVPGHRQAGMEGTLTVSS